MAEKRFFPRFPASNWWALRQQFNKTLPSVVTPSYLKSLLNLTTEKAASNLLSPLKLIGIISEDGKPTPRANDWRSDSKYDEVCKQIVKEVYPQELIDLFQGSEIDKKGVTDWLMDNAALGKGAAGLSAATYILLNQPLSNSFEERVKNPKEKRVKTKTKLPEEKTTNSVEKKKDIARTNDGSANGNNPNSPTLHIDLQIHISPEATSEQIDTIFASIAKHLYEK